MRTLTSLLFIVFTLTAFGQRSVKKAYILVDGKETSYQEYRKLDLTKFSEINVIAGNKKNVGLFGKKAKKGIVHLRTREFNDNQKKLLDDLRTEFDENRVVTTLIVINGIPYDRTQFQKDKLTKLDYRTIEWMEVPENTGMLNHKRVIVIQTNVEM